MGMLTSRISHAVASGQKVTFLLGSAISAPGGTPPEIGVPDASSLVQEVVDAFRNDDVFLQLQQLLAETKADERYQNVMKFMIDCRGQDSLNKLIESAVLRSRRTPRVEGLTSEQLETDIQGWHLRPAVKAVGEIISENGESFSAPVLTSNFDPLLEVSLRTAGRQANSLCMASDGQFSNVLSPNVTNIVHFHGYWRGSDTLHTPAQLTRYRPQLKGCLRSLLRETTLVVIGYGGWRDVFTKTLVEVISEQTDLLNVLWTFYSDTDEEINKNNNDLLKQFEIVAGQRIVFYKGVDCHVFLPHLRSRLTSIRDNAATASRLTLQQSVPIRIPISADGEDHPPKADAWVGRERELSAMLSSHAKVLAITGFGGNGKSTLAAKYAELRRESGEIQFFCWADCREKGNTLHTQLARMVERISEGKITVETLRDSNSQSVIEVLLEIIRSVKAILVFDNIDQYVDVETAKAVDTMHSLLIAATTMDHASQFVFTGRPRLDYNSNTFLQIPLEGLTADEARLLFYARGVASDLLSGSDLVNKAHALTKGHPLALNLIATQVSKNQAVLDDLINRIEAGIHDDVIHKVFEEIWGTLNTRQQSVLRYLAEQVHPSSQQRAGNYLGGVLNYNQFSKAVRALKSLNLIVVKSSDASEEETIELHPLIREFIRKRYPIEERAPYIQTIIHHFDVLIARFREKIGAAPYSVLQNWTTKVELCAHCGRYRDALTVLAEVGGALRSRGYSEEYVRLAGEVVPRLLVEDLADDYSVYDAVVKALVKVLSELGRFAEADLYAERMESTISGKTSRYVMLCDLRAFSLWLRNDWAAARMWAEQGRDIKSMGNIDTAYDTLHTLALINRDSGNVDDALKYFLLGHPLEKVLSPDGVKEQRKGAYYGNIGRCLFFKKQYDGSLVCLRRSAKLLDEAYDSDSPMNVGWAAYWIGETLEAKGELPIALSAFVEAGEKWRSVSPPRAKLAAVAVSRVKNALQERGAELTAAMVGPKPYRSWL